jgi:hypothetical protein
MISQIKKQAIPLILVFLCINAQGQTEESIPFGNMDNWLVREVKESAIIGGNTRYLYEIAPGDTLFGNIAYKNEKSPWASSTVMAKVKGVTKASITVFPEKRDHGYCARLETRLEECKVMGLLNIKVIASGTIFLGETVEPITGTSNPQQKLVTGIPFTKRPKALVYDYKVVTGNLCVKASGFGKQTKLQEKDMAETSLLLQHRWEDEKGNVFAKRIATAYEQFNQTTTTWQNRHQLILHYGDISSQNFFQPCMDLRNGKSASYTRNSKGKLVPIQETGWANPDDAVTHIILQFSSSNKGAYTGSPESCFWIDNVKITY